MAAEKIGTIRARFLKKILGLDKIDYRIRQLERAKYWKEKYEKTKS